MFYVDVDSDLDFDVNMNVDLAEFGVDVPEMAFSTTYRRTLPKRLVNAGRLRPGSGRRQGPRQRLSSVTRAGQTGSGWCVGRDF